MGLLDMLTGGKKKKAAAADPLSQILGSLGGGNPLLKMLLPMLMGGGLTSLLGKFTNAGHGNKVNSWVGTGANEELSPDEVQQALGDDEINRMANESGMAPDAVKGGLAKMLPNLINQITPGGSVPGAGQLGGLMKGLDLGSLGKLLG
jgi:uncharacterized protein YidB (DUF937 family)